VEQPITLYDVRGVDGIDPLVLPAREDTLVPLREEILLRYVVLEGQHLSGVVGTGSIVKLSRQGAEVHSDQPIAPPNHLKLQLIGRHGEAIPGDLYGKVVGNLTGHCPGFAVHFTAIPPHLMVFLQQVLAG
jgi:hypothetical protein